MLWTALTAVIHKDNLIIYNVAFFKYIIGKNDIIGLVFLFSMFKKSIITMELRRILSLVKSNTQKINTTTRDFVY